MDTQTYLAIPVKYAVILSEIGALPWEISLSRNFCPLLKRGLLYKERICFQRGLLYKERIYSQMGGNSFHVE